MGGAFRSLLCLGISSAKFRKIFSRHLCLSVYWLTKELLREPLLYLPGERQGQPVSSFVWSSCENARSPVGGPDGESWMCQVGVGAADLLITAWQAQRAVSGIQSSCRLT